MQYKLFSDYPELLEKSFQVKITQVIENWHGDEIETNLYSRGEHTIGQLVNDFDLDKIGISSKMEIKNSIVKIDLRMQTGRTKNPDYREAYNYFLIEFANLGDLLTANEIFETIGVGEVFTQ